MNYVIDTDLLLQLIEKAKNARDKYGQAEFILNQIITDLNQYPIPSVFNDFQSSCVMDNIANIHKSLLFSLQQLDSMIESLEHYVLRLETAQIDTIKKINKIIADVDYQIGNVKNILANGVFVDAYPKKSVYCALHKSEKTISVLSTSQYDSLVFISSNNKQ